MNKKFDRQMEQEQQQFDDFYDPDHQNLEPVNLNRKPDAQIDQMIGQIPKKRANKFEMTGKYQGRKHQELQHESSQQDNKQDEQEQEQSQQQQLKNYKEYRNSKKIDFDLLQNRIKQMNQEDQQFVQVNTTQKNDVGQAIGLKNQLSFYQKLIQIRYNFQKNFQQVKKFPSKVVPYNEELNYATRQTQFSTVKTIETLYGVQKQLYESTFGSQLPEFNIVQTIASEVGEGISEIEYLTQKKLNVEGLYGAYQSISSQWTKTLQESLIKWSNKTALLSQSKNNFQSLIMQTPIGQAQKILTALDKVINKSRMKRNTFKILFEQADSIKQTTNPQIFDDQDFFYEISKTYENKIERQDEDGLLMGDTRKYLAQRNNKDKERKDVDRKASKHRKIRYNVHAKLLNFTAARENPYILEARDQIVKNIFNSAPKDNEVDYLQF